MSGWITEPGWCLEWLEGTSMITAAWHVCRRNQSPIRADCTGREWLCPICGAVHAIIRARAGEGEQVPMSDNQS